jgi:hypothetical protein
MWYPQVSQSITRLLWNPKIHWRIHRIPQLISTFSHMNLLPTHLQAFFKIYLILSSYLILGLLCGVFPSVSRAKSFYLAILPMRVTCPAHLIPDHCKIFCVNCLHSLTSLSVFHPNASFIKPLNPNFTVMLSF